MPHTRPLPSGFLGLSMQYKAFEQYAGTNPKSLNPAFLNLIRQIAPDQSPVLRFGGDSTDWTWWPVPGMKKPPGVTYALTPRWLQIARAMNADLNSRLILGINLEAASVKLAQTEANALVNGIGKQSIAGLEIGNEPELYIAFNWYRQQRRRRQGPRRCELDRGRLLQAVQPVRRRDAGRSPGRRPGERLGDVSRPARRVPEGPAPRQALHLSRLPAQALHPPPRS